MTTTNRMSRIVRLSQSGKVTIPADLRRALRIGAGSLLELTLEQGGLRIKLAQATEIVGGSPWLRELYDYFAPVREEILSAGHNEDEVNADIDAAIRAVRVRQHSSTM